METSERSAKDLLPALALDRQFILDRFLWDTVHPRQRFWGQAIEASRINEHHLQLSSCCRRTDPFVGVLGKAHQAVRSEEHTSELQSLMRISYAVFCMHKKTKLITCRQIFAFTY